MSGAPSNAEFEVVDLDADHVKATFRNLVLVVWRFRTLAEPYRAEIALIKRLSLSHPEGVGVIDVVEAEATPPDSHVRRAFNETLALTCIKHISVTHECAGFKAAAVRAVVSSVYALAQPPFPHAVHSSVEEAARWTAKQNQRLLRSESAQDIERVMQAVRQVHRNRYP